MLDVSGKRRAVTSVHAFCDHAENTRIYSVFASCTAYCKVMLDVSCTRHSVTSVQVLFEHAQNTGIYNVLASLHNKLQQDVGCVWNQTRCDEHTELSRTYRECWNVRHDCFFPQHTAQACLCYHKRVSKRTVVLGGSAKPRFFKKLIFDKDISTSTRHGTTRVLVRA